MEKRQSTARMLLVLYGMLIAALLVLTLAGARFYSAAVTAREAHARQRSALAFVQNQVAACAGKGNIHLTEGPEGTALCLREPDTDYETRIYLYEGGLYSEFSRRTAAIQPENGTKICSAASFLVQWQSERLLKITANGMTAYACCDGGGGDGGA